MKKREKYTKLCTILLSHFIIFLGFRADITEKTLKWIFDIITELEGFGLFVALQNSFDEL